MDGTRRALVAAVLALLLLASCGEASDVAAPVDSGVRGRVLLGPQCPVEQEGVRCPDEAPAGATVTAYERVPGESYTHGKPVGSAETDNDGRYEIPLAPGEYVVSADAGMSCELMDVVVPDGGFATMDVPCDTGIR